MSGKELCEETVRLLRIQRHDFINHIQVIQALLQLGKTERALKYIEDMVHSPEMTGDLRAVYGANPDCRQAE